MSIFTKSNMVIRTELVFDKFNIDIPIPFSIKLSTIPSDFFEEEEYVIEDYGNQFAIEFDSEDIRNKNLNLLSNVDLKRFTFDDVDEEYKPRMKKTTNGYVFISVEDLYSFLITELRFGEVDFVIIENFIIEQWRRLIKSFSELVEKELKIGSGTDECTEAYMELRSAFELNKPPIFKENIGKCVAEHSFRETKLQRIYIGRKCEIDKVQYEKHMKDTKNKK